LLHPETTDMRKAVNGLTAIVQENMRQGPFNGSVYLFCIQAGQSGKPTAVILAQELWAVYFRYLQDVSKHQKANEILELRGGYSNGYDGLISLNIIQP